MLDLYCVKHMIGVPLCNCSADDGKILKFSVFAAYHGCVDIPVPVIELSNASYICYIL